MQQVNRDEDRCNDGQGPELEWRIACELVSDESHDHRGQKRRERQRQVAGS